jgi:RNA polymerase sigma-70 factor (ECF subfamily)
LTEGSESMLLGLAPVCAESAAPPRDLDEFLAGVERRAFRVAEIALGHREDALDAVQEAMIRLLRYRGRPAVEWSPLFWGILRRQRECYLLRELQGLDVADTAAAMGCSEGSVKTHLSRALHALRAQLEDWR